MRLLLVWLINALSLLAVPYVLPSVSVDSFYIALVTALVLGLVNALIRPLLVLVTLPITILTLGLFTLVINGLLFWFVASFVEGFRVAGCRRPALGPSSVRHWHWPGRGRPSYSRAPICAVTVGHGSMSQEHDVELLMAVARFGLNRHRLADEVLEHGERL